VKNVSSDTLYLIPNVKFNYQVRTEEGEIKTGVVEASSKEAALVLLQKYKFYVTYLEEESSPFYAKKIKIFQKISLKDVVLFSRQLAIMFGSRVPLGEALITLANQAQNPEMREKIFDLVKEIEAGSAFSKALFKHPKIFSPFFIAMVKSGESVGKLSESLNYLADHLEREYSLRAKIKGAMLYPALVLIVFLAILGLMVFSVLPGFERMFLEAGIEIPAITRIVLSSSRLLRENWLLLLIPFLAIFFAIYCFSRTKEGKKFFDRFFLKLPILSSLLKQLSLSQVAANLSTLISGGLLITRALELVGEIIGNSLYKEAIFSINEGVKKGMSISSVSVLYPEIFPPLFNQMVLIGEKTGALDVTLMNVANFYQKEIDRAVEDILKILEPVIVVLLAVIVGGLMLTVFLPLYGVIGIY